ncbi:MAG: hypothetical protein E6J41_31915 [Chloroflexi bacterium]|nr:MAG: hypothetical protein E6J41_31915 [Chloroflexota bacterium]
MSTYDSLSTVRPYRIWNGAVARAVAGERITFAVVDLEPNLVVPEHQHRNEQVGLVLQGFVTMTGPEGATVIDVFNPTREDWEQVERLEPSAGAWPA